LWMKVIAGLWAVALTIRCKVTVERMLPPFLRRAVLGSAFFSRAAGSI